MVKASKDRSTGAAESEGEMTPERSENEIYDEYCRFLESKGYISLEGNGNGPWLHPTRWKWYTTPDAMKLEMPEVFGAAPTE